MSGPRPDVVVVGAGVVGASVAWHCARAGLRVQVIDRAPGPGAGSTGRATGGFRAQYGTAINVRLSLLARERMRALPQETGVDPEFRPVGYLFLARTAAHLNELTAAHALQQREGLTEARLLSPGEAGRVNPHVDLDGVVGAAWGPSDGVMRPLRVLEAFLAGAARHGAEVRFGVEALGADLAADGSIARLQTSAGALEAGWFVDAGGPWAAAVARLAGVELPVIPLRRQVGITAPTDALPADFPLTIWCDDGFHLRVRDGRVLLLRPTDGNPRDPFDTSVEEPWLDTLEVRARSRVPALRGVPLDRAASWAGLYEMSPDHHALFGPAPGCPNLFLVNGHSGHGVMHSPAFGLLAAEWLSTGAARSLDVRTLRPSRFAEGEPIVGSALL